MSTNNDWALKYLLSVSFAATHKRIDFRKLKDFDCLRYIATFICKHLCNANFENLVKK